MDRDTGEKIVHWALSLSYGFFSVILMLVAFQLLWFVTGYSYTYTIVDGIVECPNNVLIPFGFVSFMTAAIASMFRGFNLIKAVLFGFAGLFAMTLSVVLILFLSQEPCPIIAMINVAIYASFVTSTGIFFLNYSSEAIEKEERALTGFVRPKPRKR